MLLFLKSKTLKRNLFFVVFFVALGAGILLPTAAFAAPVIDRLNPSSVAVGRQVITVIGSGFVNGMNVYDRSFGITGNTYTPELTTFVDANTLRFEITTSVNGSINQATTYNIVVGQTNPAGFNNTPINLSNEKVLTVPGTADVLTNAARTVISSLTNPTNLLLLIMIGLQKLYGIFFWLLAKATYSLFTVTIESLLNNNTLSITRNTAFLAAWNTVKGYANMLIILELIAAAVMMILNLWKDNAKKIVTWVIIIAIIVNFSTLICGIMIDLSNIVMKSLIGDTTNFNIIENINTSYNAFLGNFNNSNQAIFPITAQNGDVNTQQAAQHLVVALIFNIMYLSTAFVFLYFIVILLQRYIYLAFLFIVSPLAFALWAFPKTEHFFSSWWKKFWENCFIGVGAAFCIHLAFALLQTSTSLAANNAQNLNLGNNTFFPNAANLIAISNIFFSFAIVLGFLFFGLRLASKTAGPIGDAIMSAVAALTVAVVEAIVTGGASLSTSAGGLASKAVDVGTKGLGKASEAITGGDALSKGFGNSKVVQGGMDWMKTGLSGKPGELEGLAKKQQEEKLADPRKRYAAISDVDRLVKELKKSRNETEKAAILERIGQLGGNNAVNKEFGALAKDMRRKAIAQGVDANKILTADDAELDTRRVKEERRKVESTFIPGTTKDRNGDIVTAADKESYLKEESEFRARQYYFARMDDGDIKKMDDDALVKLASQKTAEGAKAMEEAIQRGIVGKVQKELGTIDDLADRIDHNQKTYGSNARKSAQKSNPLLIQYNKKAIGDRLAQKGVNPAALTPAQLAIEEDIAAEELLNELYRAKSGKDITEMDTEAFTDDFAEQTSAEKIKKSDSLGLSPDRRAKLKLTLPSLRAQRNALRAIPTRTPSEEQKLKEVKAKIKAIKAL